MRSAVIAALAVLSTTCGSSPVGTAETPSAGPSASPTERSIPYISLTRDVARADDVLRMETNSGTWETGYHSLFEGRTDGGWEPLYVLREARKGTPDYFTWPSSEWEFPIAFGGKFETRVTVPPVEPGEYRASKEFKRGDRSVSASVVLEVVS